MGTTIEVFQIGSLSRIEIFEVLTEISIRKITFMLTGKNKN
jgi:hypothetical protein